MNNQFTLYVKKTKVKVISKLMGLVFIILLVTILSMKLNPFIVIPCFFAIFIIILSITTNKETKQIIKYNLGSEINSNIYIPLVYDMEYLNKISKELNDKIEIPNNIDNLVNYVQYMIDNNQMIFVETRFKLNTIVNLINNLLKTQNNNLQIDINDILRNDDEIIKLRRQDNITTDFHDLACIRRLLENNQLELITFFAPYDGFSKLVAIDGYVLSIVPLEKVDTLKKLQIEVSNKLDYK